MVLSTESLLCVVLQNLSKNIISRVPELLPHVLTVHIKQVDVLQREDSGRLRRRQKSFFEIT